MKFLPIVLTCDDKYTKYASVVIASIIKNRNTICKYEINIISDYISPINQEKIQRQVSDIPHFEVKFIHLDNLS